jgi:hypothetical protein
MLDISHSWYLTMTVIDAVCGFDDLDLAVLLVLSPGYIDDLVVAENFDSPFVGIEFGVLVVDVDVVLSVPIFFVLAFLVFCVGMFTAASEFRLSIGQRSIALGFE